jgi:hypothetical protein
MRHVAQEVGGQHKTLLMDFQLPHVTKRVSKDRTNHCGQAERKMTPSETPTSSGGISTSITSMSTSGRCGWRGCERRAYISVAISEAPAVAA